VWDPRHCYCLATELAVELAVRQALFIQRKLEDTEHYIVVEQGIGRGLLNVRELYGM
jgi:hypothetical protein